MSLATVLVLLPPPLLAAAAVVGWCLRARAPGAGRPAAAAAAWLGLALVVGAWFAGGRASQDLTAPLGVAGVPLVLRVDALTVFLWLVVLVPVALLLTFQRRTGEQAALAALAAAAALATLAAGSVGMTAFGLATCAGLVLVLLGQEEGATPATLRSYWVALSGAWLLLTWAAVLLEVTSGTSAYSAVPVTAFHAPLLALLVGATLLCSGLLPSRTWVSEMWSRSRLEAGTLAVALLVPVGLSPLVRAYGLGGGQLPSPLLNVALTVLGAAAALGAAMRAQAAPSRRGFLAETVPLAGGMVLLALGLGTPLGMVAGLACLAGVGAAAGLAPLAADARGELAALSGATLVGVPPTLVFGGWLLAVQAAVEAGGAAGFLGLAAALAWLVAVAAAARAARLPVAPADAGAAGPEAMLAGAAVALVGGVGLTALLALLAVPAAAEVMPPTGRLLRPVVSAAGILSPGSLTVSTASGGWAPALLGGPVVALGLAGAAVARMLGRRAFAAPPVAPPAEVPEPLFRVPLTRGAGALERLRSIRLPEQYRSLFQPRQLERAAAGPPWFWVLITVALAFLVTR